MHPKREPFFIIKTLLLLVFSCLLFSCVSTKKAAYFNNVNDTPSDLEIFGPSTPEHAQFRRRLNFGSLWTIGVKATF